MPLNTFDLLILACLLVFTAIGAWRGLVREAVSFATWVLASLLAWLYAGDLARAFEGLTGDPVLRQVLAFAAIFAAVFIIGAIAGALLHRLLLRNASFRVTNRILGGCIGLARGSVVILIVFLLAGLTDYPQRPWWRAALLAPLFERVALYATGYIPPDVARHIRYG